MPLTRFLISGCALLAFAAPATALAAGGGSPTTTTTTTTTTTPTTPTTPAGTGGAGIGSPSAPPSTPAQPTVSGYRAKIIDNVAYAPSDAPLQVKQAIWAGNQIRTKPYIYGGGHGSWKSPGYDCSGSVSYVLHAAGLLRTPEASGDMESWGQHGIGQWITVYANGGHAFVEIAGIRFDTSAEQDPNPPAGTGPRWRPVMHSTGGFVARHPANL